MYTIYTMYTIYYTMYTIYTIFGYYNKRHRNRFHSHQIVPKPKCSNR